MTHEVSDWKETGCTLECEVGKLSDREPFSREINEVFGEGGGLNANYTTAEAIAKAANILGRNHFVYGKHFIFKRSGLNRILFDFCNKAALESAKETLQASL